MRVQHNITAMNSYRNYNTNTRSINKNLEKLSSGYKINRAGDDAAGLAISEKMRAQITGIEVAQKNAKDGISLVQTAEGALTEVHSMLNRMYQLAEQSANGTYAGKDNATGSSAIDREQLNKEVEQLRNEINRITSTANFNGVSFFTGTGDASSVSEPTVAVTTDADNIMSGTPTIAWANDASADDKKALAEELDSKTFTIKTASGSADVDAGATTLSGGFTFTGTAATGYRTDTADGSIAIKNASGNTVATLSYTVAAGAADDKSAVLTVSKADSSSSTSNANAPTFKDLVTGNSFGITGVDLSKAASIDQDADVNVEFQATGTKLIMTIGNDNTYEGSITDGATNVTLTKTDGTETIDVTLDGRTIDVRNSISKDKVGTAEAAASSDSESVKLDSDKVNLQIGAEASSANILAFDKMDMSEETLKIDSNSVDISTQQQALDSLANIKNAINIVSGYRGTYGAMQNRLEHTINNLSAMQENLQDAESTIRDTDVADEMMKYTKNSILVQSAQAMLAQANQQPQGVLQLLQ